LSAIEGLRSDLRRRDAAVGSHDIHAEMAPWHRALRHVVDIVMILVGHLEESKALNVEVGGVLLIVLNLSTNQKTGIVAQILDIIGCADLLDKDAVQIDVHAGIRMPGHFQVVPDFLLNSLDLREPFSAGDSKENLEILVSLFDFDGSGREDVVVLVFGRCAVDLKTRLHRQALHALQRIP